MKQRLKPKTTETLDHLFNPNSIAIIGASNNPGKWGFLIPMNLLLGGYRGKIYPINPKEKEILDLPAYPSIADVPEPVDLVLVVVPPPKVPQVIRECGGKAKVALVITAGFGELGPEEKELENDLVRAAREGDIRVVGPNCNGIMCSGPTKLYALMPSYFPRPEPFSLASQSGNVGGIMLRMSMRRGCLSIVRRGFIARAKSARWKRRWRNCMHRRWRTASPPRRCRYTGVTDTSRISLSSVIIATRAC